MTTGYFDAYKKFLKQLNSQSTLNKKEHQVSDGRISKSPYTDEDFKSFSDASLKDKLYNISETANILNYFKSPIILPVKMEVNDELEKNDYPYSVLKNVNDKNAAVIIESSGDLNSLEGASVRNPNVAYDDDQYEEAVFIPFNPDDCLMNCYNQLTKVTSVAKRTTQKSKVRRYRRNQYRGPIVYGRHKRRRPKFIRKFVQKPRVIVEMSPAVGISLSDISAFKDSESDTANNSDNDINSSVVLPPTKHNGSYMQGEVLHEPNSHGPKVVNDRLNDFALSPAKISRSSSSDTHISETSFENIPEPEEPFGNAESVEEIKKLFVPEPDCQSDSYLEIGEQIEVCDSRSNSLPVELNDVSSDATETFTSETGSSDEDESLSQNKKLMKCALVNNFAIKNKGNIPANVTSRLRKSHKELNFQIQHGRGIKLGKIDYIRNGVMEASLQSLSALHIILYDVPVPLEDNVCVNQARENILQFSGFPYRSEKSSAYSLKKIRLKRIPYKVLKDVVKILFPHKTLQRKELVDTILAFFMQPRNENCGNSKKRNHLSDEELSMLKKEIMLGKGPTPVVVVKKLSTFEIDKYSLRHVKKDEVCTSDNMDHSNNAMISAAILEKNHQYPAYLSSLIANSAKEKTFNNHEGMDYLNASTSHADIKNLFSDKIAAVLPAVRQSFIERGCGKMLKSFPDVAMKVTGADKRTIQMLHAILFGVTDEVEKCRSNILEFSGFPEYQKYLFPQRRRFLELMLPSELEKICQLLNLCYTEENKCRTIDLLLEHLQEPSEKLMQKNFELFSALLCDKPQGKPLRSFDNIRFNVECASSDDLIELHDVIFVKSCDSFEIHQRILDFTGFSFDANSYEYQCRKTLMCYMNYSSVQKIAKLLGLQGTSSHMHKDEIASCILKFLMDPKVPVSGISCTLSSTKAHIVKLKTAESDGANDSRNSYNQQCNTPDSPQLISMFDNHQATNSKVPLSESASSCFDPFQSDIYCKKDKNIGLKSFSSAISPEDISSSDDDTDSMLPLSALISHPCDNKLKKDIQEIIQGNLSSLTLNGLVNKVLSKYPEFDLRYRKKFIKSKARKILSQMQNESFQSAKED